MSAIRRMVANPVAANMLMILILGGGLVSSLLIPRELFPEFNLDHIIVTVPYPGAAPADIEVGICQKIEDQIEGLEGIKEITSESREGLGTILLELETGANLRKVLDEVKSEVDKIDFPPEAEDPNVVEVTLRHHVIQVAVAGDAPERTLKEIAEEIRDELTDLPEISQVSVTGVREYEIVVEVSEQTLRRYELTLGDVSRAIRSHAFDLPAGRIKTRAGELTIRVMGQRYRAAEYEDIPLLSRSDGTVVRLGDVAVVREGFQDVDVGGQFNGQPAALVGVFKTADEDTLTIAEAVRRYVYGSPPPPEGGPARLLHDIKRRLTGAEPVIGKKDRMPAGITLETWSDLSKFVEDRLDMLIRNGIQGLILVVLVLWLFLGWRLSLWVAMGIPVSLMGAMLVLHMGGQTLNMMSMFALIMALGLIVDDAIIVGENVFSRVERGHPPRQAAVVGAQRVLLPVVGAVVTTWLAFAPLLLIPGIMGKFIMILPIAVITALAFSLVECLIILPPHLAHSLQRQQRRRASRPGDSLARRVRARLDAALTGFIEGAFAPVYRLLTRYRYVTVAAALGVLVVMIGAYRGGHVKFVTFPKVDSDTLLAGVTMPTGTSIDRTGEVARRIADAAGRLNEQFATATGGPVVLKVYSGLGQTSGFGGDVGSHVGEVIVELQPSEQRGRVRSEDLITRWRKNTGPIPGAQVTFGSFRGGPGGKPLEMRLLAEKTEQLKRGEAGQPSVVERLIEKLRAYPGVSDVVDDSLPGKIEMRVKPSRLAQPLGVTQTLLAEQLRDAFYGNEAVKVQRGRDEIKIMVRFPDRQRRSIGDIERMRIRTPAGAEVPFGSVADVTMDRGYTTLRRVGGKSVVTVSADLDEDVANAEEVLKDLADSGFLTSLRRSLPGLRIDFRGQRQQATESLDALKPLFMLALLGIYTILAAVFKSYLQPVIIMLAIPFGLIGAVVGHWIVGYPITLLSVFGMVALAGIVVNDSLVLIDFVNIRIRRGEPVFASAEQGARRRFRPILLTTVTTVLGMTPILLERSFQAQFLKPMVIAITFGLMLATSLTLLVVPSLYLIGNDLRRVGRWLRTGAWVAPEGVVAVEQEIGQDIPDEADEC